MIKLNEQNFQILVSYWAGKLRLPLPLFKRDNRDSAYARMSYCEDCRVYNFQYNFKKIKQIIDAQVMSLIFHELGHIKAKFAKRVHTEKSGIENEYKAEKFSLKMIKKYYPDYYEPVCKEWRETLKDKEWRKVNSIHAKAFDKIKDYK